MPATQRFQIALGMSDSGFQMAPSQNERLAWVHRRNPDGSLEATDFILPARPEFWEGGGGLYSTGADYLRFLNVAGRRLP